MSTHDELLREIGVRLREARENRNLTHRDLWRTTRIPIAILDALERFDRARLPQSFYVREFVQTYAAEVGLDPADIADYLAATRSEQPGESSNGAVAASAPLASGKPSPRSGSRGLSLPSGSRTLYVVLAGRPAAESSRPRIVRGRGPRQRPARRDASGQGRRNGGGNGHW
jgi:cytoskeletal protein RodZ